MPASIEADSAIRTGMVAKYPGSSRKSKSKYIRWYHLSFTLSAWLIKVEERIRN